MTRRVLAFLLALPMLAACGSEVAAPPPAAPGERDTPTGDYVSDGLPGPFSEGDVLRVIFRDGEISFQATCNTMSGLAELEDEVLVVSSVGGTEMGCLGAGHEQDEWLVDFFTSSPALTVDGTDVRLANDDAEIWLVPADEVAPSSGPEVPLEGTRWELTGIEESDGDSIGMMGVPRRLDARLEIAGDRVLFFAGCNAGGGGVTVVDDRLRLRRVAIELRGCPGIRQQVESAQLPVLMASWVDWSIDGRELRLTRGDTSLLYRAGPSR